MLPDTLDGSNIIPRPGGASTQNLLGIRRVCIPSAQSCYFDSSVHRAAGLACSWWRRGRVELPVQKTPRSGYATGLAGDNCLAPTPLYRRQDCAGASRKVFGPSHRRQSDRTSIYGAHSPPSRIGGDGRSRPVRRLGLAVACQLFFCHLFTRLDGASACNPAETSPVEPTRPHYLSIISSPLNRVRRPRFV